MTYLETQLDSYWQHIVKSPGRCIFCPEHLDLHAHHLFYGSWKSVWYFRWTPAFGVPLCRTCHIDSPAAPHVGEQLFWLKLKSSLKVKDPQRWNLICYYRQSKVIIPEKPDLKVLLADLKKQAGEIESTNWMDLEVDASFRGRNEQGQEMWS